MNSSLMLPDISPHLYEDAYPPSPLVGLPKDPHVARRVNVFTAVPPRKGRQVNHPHALPLATADMLEDERVRANQVENRADFNEIRLWELQAQMDIMEREVQGLRNSLNHTIMKKDEAEREVSEARKREQRLREYRAEEEGWDEGGWLTSEKNYDSVWQEGWAQGYEEGHKEERLATGKDYDVGWQECWPVAHEKGRTQGYRESRKEGRPTSRKTFDAGWRECWPVAHKDGRAQGYEEGYEEGREEGRLMGWRGCWPVAYEEGQKQRSGDALASYGKGLKGHREARKRTS